MKDEDLKALDLHTCVTAAERDRLLEQIKKDTALFERHNIMDYSMLLACHSRCDKTGGHTQKNGGYVPAHRRCESGILKALEDGDAPDQQTIYYLGIIDITQLWDWKKAGENFAKGKLLCKGTHGISAVEPTEYRERYLAAMAELIVAVD